jgi:TolB-like protein/Tfp pilus assembly protein PilF/class 3 adenylate cyclase
MASEIKKEIQLEIAHVLFIDIVGYSKLLIDEQRDYLHTLNEVVRETDSFRAAEAAGKLTRLPTGDGMALVFATTPDAPVSCALQVSKALRSHPELGVRMGIHSGPVSGITDVNDRSNVAGAGINLAQRVMDCGDAGHVLLSKHVADDLEQYRQWRSHLHDLGECAVKHDVRVHVVNLYTDELGNPETPEKFQQTKVTQPALATPVSEAKPARRPGALIAVLIIGAALAAAAGFYIFSHRAVPKAPPSATAPAPVAIPEKSIAVLPFENLSEEKANAYFADGIQEEILTRLSKIADLKVISRTSTQHYKSAPENLPEIARQLGVAHILEGSVQRSADQVRVNVQLIKAATDDHLWADTFDRKLTDIFAVESEIAKTIADTLQAKLTGSEKTAIAKRPTVNSEAYELYLKGRYFWNKRTANDFKTAIAYFQQAIDKDPNFALAYAGLADSYVLLSAYGAGSPQESFPLAKAAAKKALEIDNTLAEAHTSLGNILCVYDFDFASSTKEFERAIALDPNYATAHHWYGGGPPLCLGEFDKAIAEQKRAVELDPLSLGINADLGNTYYLARRYDEAIEQLRKTIEMDPGFYDAHFNLGQALEAKGALDAAIEEYQKARALNDDPEVLALLGHAYASSGNKTEALKILDQLKELSKKRYVSAYNFAIVYLGLGDKEEALRWLQKSYQDRAGNDIGYISVDPFLDPLRGDPRFEALAEKIVPRSAK